MGGWWAGPALKQTSSSPSCRRPRRSKAISKTVLRRPSGAIFDFGDTILRFVSADWTLVSSRLLELAEDRKGLTVADVKNLSDEMGREIFPAREASALELRYEGFLKLLCETLGVSLKVGYSEAAEQMLQSSSEYVPTEGIIGVLELLRSNSVRMAILSNSAFAGTILKEVLARHGMDHFFSFVISSADYGIRKPHRRIIDLAVKKLGTSPGDTWFVGDNVQNDVQGALNCGLFPVWYNPKKASSPLQGKCFEVTDWREFADRIRLLYDH